MREHSHPLTVGAGAPVFLGNYASVRAGSVSSGRGRLLRAASQMRYSGGPIVSAFLLLDSRKETFLV